MTENLEAVMGLIIHAGNAKSDAMDAIRLAKEGKFEEAQQKIQSAHMAIVEAHHVQTEMLTQEAQGNSVQVTLLTVHSQDHLMTAISFVELAQEIIDLHQSIKEIQ